MCLNELAERIHNLPWGRFGVPDPLTAYIPVAPQRRPLDGGAARITFELLGALALTGWSVRRDLLAVVNYRRELADKSATYRQAWRTVTGAGLMGAQRARFSGRPVILTWLTDLGRTALLEAGVPVVPSEWETITTQHRGAQAGDQDQHTAAICMFLSHARRRGYTTTACPSVAGSAEPDALIEQAEQRIYVEVQRRGGDRVKHVAKWRNQLALQGFVAICAEFASQTPAFIREAQELAQARGVITDLGTLAGDRHAPLWTHYWPSAWAPAVALDSSVADYRLPFAVA